jgi:hypothetical protein
MGRIALVNLADKQGIEVNAPPPASTEPRIFHKNKGHKLNRDNIRTIIFNSTQFAILINLTTEAPP